MSKQEGYNFSLSIPSFEEEFTACSDAIIFDGKGSLNYYKGMRDNLQSFVDYMSERIETVEGKKDGS